MLQIIGGTLKVKKLVLSRYQIHSAMNLLDQWQNLENMLVKLSVCYIVDIRYSILRCISTDVSSGCVPRRIMQIQDVCLS